MRKKWQKLIAEQKTDLYCYLYAQSATTKYSLQAKTTDAHKGFIQMLLYVCEVINIKSMGIGFLRKKAVGLKVLSFKKISNYLCGKPN